MKRRTVEKFELDFEFDKDAILDSLGTRYVAYLEEKFVKESFDGNRFIRVLDIGTGTGRIIESIVRQHSVELVGVDLSRQMINQARKRVKGVDFVLADADILPFRSSVFDLVVAIRVLRYMSSWRQSIKEASRIIRRSGCYVFNTSNKHSLQFFAYKKGVYLSLDLRGVLGFLEEKGFVVLRFKSQKRLPANLYRRINGTVALRVASLLEGIMDKVFPKSLLSTDVLIRAKRVQDSA